MGIVNEKDRINQFVIFWRLYGWDGSCVGQCLNYKSFLGTGHRWATWSTYHQRWRSDCLGTTMTTSHLHSLLRPPLHLGLHRRLHHHHRHYQCCHDKRSINAIQNNFNILQAKRHNSRVHGWFRGWCHPQCHVQCHPQCFPKISAPMSCSMSFFVWLW